jgi:hypothetical protein
VDKALRAASTHHLLTVDALRLSTLPGWVKSLSEIALKLTPQGEKLCS